MKSSSTTHTTPFDDFTTDTLSKVLEASEGVTPVYVYSENYLRGQAQALKEIFQAEERKARGLPECTIRYAMKAWSNVNVLRLFASEGLHFDCSSVYNCVLQAVAASSKTSSVSWATPVGLLMTPDR
jgi:diaminopimelate decarboxylase